MRRLLAFTFIAATHLAAQVGSINNPPIIVVSSAPSGACSTNLPDQQVVTTGLLYSCQSGTWTQISGSGGSPAFSAITSGTNTTAAMVVGTGASFTISTPGAASASAFTMSGAPFTGGTGTTTFPLFYINNGTAPTDWATTGTAFGVNLPSGSTADFFRFHVNGAASVASLTSVGGLTVGSSVTAGTQDVLSAIGIRTFSTGLIGWTNGTGTSGTLDTLMCRGAAGGAISFESAATCTNTLAGATGNIAATQVFAGSVGQLAASNTGGTCAMSSGTTCTITLGHTYTTPVCIVTVQSATLTGGVAGCTVSGTTVTITAATSNSLTWGAFVFGNPN